MAELPHTTTQHGSIGERRAAILGSLAAKPRCSRAAARSAGVALGLSERQVFNLVRRLRAGLSYLAAIGLSRSTGGRGQSRLAPSTEQTVRRFVEDLRRSSPLMRTKDTIAEVRRLCHEQRLPVPSVSTIRRRLRSELPDKPIRTAPAVNSVDALPMSGGTSLGRRATIADLDLGLLTLLYETVGEAGGWATFLSALALSYSGGIGMLLVYDFGIRNGFVQAAAPAEPDHISAYNSYYASISPWLPPLGKRSSGVVVQAESLLSRTDLVRTEFYCDFLRPVHLDSGVTLIVQKDGSRLMIVSVVFPQKTADTDPDTIGRLQRLQPHLLRVAQLNRQLADLEARSAAAEALLNGLATAMLVVTDGGRVVYMNVAAERIIAASDGPTITRTALDTIFPDDGRALRELITSALRVSQGIATPPGGVMRIGRPSGRAPYEVMVAPISNITLGLSFSGPLAAVFVRDPEARTVMPLDWLRRLYSLTPAEARVMQSLLAGDTLDTVADRGGVTRETVRSQLKAIFLKTDTSSQTELIRLGLRGLAAIPRGIGHD